LTIKRRVKKRLVYMVPLRTYARALHGRYELYGTKIAVPSGEGLTDDRIPGGAPIKQSPAGAAELQDDGNSAVRPDGRRLRAENISLKLLSRRREEQPDTRHDL
jgi:hypothetical protein